jgi:TetR/AcrR family transcriptional regulator
LYLLLSFTEKNPGITRILTGDPLSGESDRLRVRVAQFFDRLETQLRQMLRESELRDGYTIDFDIPATANLMLSVVEGRISQFVRSNFEQKPTQDWEQQWQIISLTIFPANRADS